MGAKKNIWIFCIILIIQCIVIVVWGAQKERLNVDEMFTMEGVKQGGFGVRYWDIPDDFYGNEHTNQEFLEHMTVHSDELLVFQGADEVASALIHRVFYYTILNLAVTIYPDHIPWSVGVGVNLLCFIITQIMLYLITKEVHDNISALCTVLIYGLSAGAISTVLYVRCYMMLTMFELLLIYLYIRFVRTEKNRVKGACLLCSIVLAYVCYRLHQFGTILFAVTTFLFIIYMIINKKRDCLLWFAVGYGIPLLIGARIIIPLVRFFLSGNIAQIFYSNAKLMSLTLILNQTIQLLKIMAGHLFVNIGVMSLGIVIILFLYVRIIYQEKGERGGQSGRLYRKDINFDGVSLIVLMAAVAVIYYCILFLGDAVVWKYMSPAYPIIVMIVVICVRNVWTYSGKYNIAAIAVGICLLLVSYDTQHISELYPGEEAYREALEEKYHGMNGIMVHHDVQGDGENWLYEAATLWPQESNVLIIQNKVLRERELCYTGEDDKILLWLTVDYDRDEAMALFQECTDYVVIEPVLHTDHIWVYECSK